MTTTRTATCRCGQLRVNCTGAPVRVSICHCLNCKKRSGSAFSYQARWPNEAVEIIGKSTTWSQAGDSGHRATFQFCPECGATVVFTNEGTDTTAVAIGAFADPEFQSPQYSVYENRKHSWFEVTGEGIEHD